MENVRVFFGSCATIKHKNHNFKEGWGGGNKKQEQEKRSIRGPSQRPTCSEGPLLLWGPYTSVWGTQAGGKQRVTQNI